MTIRILVVEDDKYFRYAIKKVVNWEQYGFEVVGEAVHGQAALEYLEKQRVEIVLTDMSMPVMNGIELTAAVKEKYPEIMVIALSAYDDFEFVKESLTQGATDYVLKQDIDQQDFAQQVLSTWRKYLYNLLTGKLKDKAIRFITEKDAGVNNPAGRYLELLLGTDFGFYLCVVRNMDKGWCTDKCRQEKWLSDNGIFEIHKADHHIIFLPAQRSPSSSNMLEQKNAALANVNEVIKGENCIAACSDYIENVGKIRKGYDEILDIQGDARFSKKHDRVFTRENTSRGTQPVVLNLNDINRATTYDMAVSELDKLTEDIRRGAIEPTKLDLKYLEFISHVADNMQFEMDRIEFVKIKKALETKYWLDEKQLIVREFFKVFFDTLNTGKMHVSISKGVEYLEKNYDMDLTLQQIAHEVGMSESYYSSLFKKETGKTVFECLNLIRIKHAKELIISTDLKNYEIGEKVGIANASYFSTLFKKETGMTIQEFKYKNKIMNK